MVNSLAVIVFFCLYIVVLFFIALWVERKADAGTNIGNNPIIYSLSLAVYCTTWTYYGSVGIAANSGILFLTTYLGPTIAITVWWTILRKMIRIKNSYRITSIADFISARYDKSRTIAAIATGIVIVGIVPYVALQLKAALTSFEILTHAASSPFSHPDMGLIFVALMIIFTIIFGVRRLDITERHQGMVVALAVECMVKLIAFLAAGIFVTYFLFDGFGDILARVSEMPTHAFYVDPSAGNSPYFTWLSYLILSMSAILFLPRQFHVGVIENFNEGHVRTAMWLFPLYLFLINIFVIPIAMAGLLLGHPAHEADMFVLSLPFHYGQKWLAMLVFIGGLSAATGMIMISSMTMSTMVTNHLLLPVFDWLKGLRFLKRYLLQCRWITVTMYILVSYWYAQHIGESYMLVNIGMISFAAVLQFAPAIIGGLFWRKGSKGGAILGLCAGFLLWFYTLLLPAFDRSGVIWTRLLVDGPMGIDALKPEHLFGIYGLDPFSHAVFWTMLFNIGFYLLGSLYFKQSEQEQSIADGFVNILGRVALTPAIAGRIVSALADKQKEIEKVLVQYFPIDKADSIIRQCMSTVGIEEKEKISIVELIELLSEIEKVLAGSIGAAAAHHALSRGIVFTPEEERELSKTYADIIANLKLTPQDLKAKIDYYQERQNLLTSQAVELQEKVSELNREIVERRKVEEALSESEEQFRTLVNNVNVGVYRNTSGQGRFIRINPAMVKIFGYDSEEEFIKVSVADLYQNSEERKRFIEEIRRNGYTKDMELALRKQDGTPIWCSITATPQHDENGEIKWIDGVLEDITERKRLEEQLRQAQKMEAIGTLAGGVAHDFNNILTAIMGYANLLVLRMGKDNPHIGYVNEILASSERAANLTSSLLAFSRKQVINPKPVNLNEIVKKIDKLLVRVIGEDIEFRTILSDKGLTIMADSGQIEQVLMNLATNARDAMPDGGILTIKTGRFDFSEVPPGVFVKPGAYAVIQVSDTGTGMNEATRQRIFEPFFTTKEVGKGTGLGLSIVYGIIKQHEGEITVYSEPGKGSTFKIYLKLLESHDEITEIAAPASLVGGAETILIAEDDVDVRRFMKRILEEYGYTVIEAVDGEDAILKFSENMREIDLLIVDVVMPKKNGKEVYDEVRKAKGDVRVLFSSGYTSDIIHQKGILEEGMNFISKPVSPQRLLSIVREMLSR
jgi:PAS domain S-box-containing protein